MADAVDRFLLRAASVGLAIAPNDLEACKRESITKTLANCCDLRWERDEEPSGEFITELLTMRPGGVGGASSLKLSNARLSLTRLATLIGSGTLTVAGAASLVVLPWPFAFVVLAFVYPLEEAVRARIDERVAVVMWVVWDERGARCRVARDALLPLVNGELRARGRQEMSDEELSDCLAELERLRCIELSDDNVIVRESVHLDLS
jgi:hypothetical protein